METPGKIPGKVPSEGEVLLGFIELQCMVESSLIHTLSSSAGNIDALKDMPLTSLNLRCTNLEGRPRYQS